ncbi:homoserine O-succinyltransferase [Natranaerovirga pectinivora]|uniref:Homoserine O-acetyltransferase n=1 Tax=Natranaerovirga pectinivora TaxID=682400 RepID=A0A4R3MMF4_9FIRM|nr:homoserine O-succinyltransferase [Natranaerovirga pectinivora]TCT15435.1 homoserine O-succinyltransferase [Natranaerovirga pectinivora]
MPIKIPNNLPAKKILQNENIFIMDENRAIHQDIRELQILILNLMPLKQETECQLLRVLSNSPLQTEVTFMSPKTYTSKNTSQEHLFSFYTTFDKVCHKKFDGMIITGAPIEHLEFEEVSYWDELKAIMKWSEHNVTSTLHICWGAQAGLYYHYGIKKHSIDKKMFGVFNHQVLDPHTPLVRGFDEEFFAPHSRHTTVKREDIIKNEKLEIIAESEEAGVHMVIGDDGKNIFITGHSEYDAHTLKNEYLRDVSKGLEIEIPFNYFDGDDVEMRPRNTWKAHAHLLFSNWLNYYVYQMTPYKIEEVGEFE